MVYISPFTELYLYEFETKQQHLLTQMSSLTDPLPSSKYEMILIGWLTDDILLYATRNGENKWWVNSIEISSRHITPLISFDTRDLTDATFSPNGRNVMLTLDIGCPLLAIDPQTQVTTLLAIKFGCGFHPVWHPDNQVSLGASFDDIFAIDLSAVIPSPSEKLTPTTVEIRSPALSAPLSWSDNGRYLIYKDLTTREGIVVDVQTGQTQIIGDPFFEFVGWLHKE